MALEVTRNWEKMICIELDAYDWVQIIDVLTEADREFGSAWHIEKRLEKEDVRWREVE